MRSWLSIIFRLYKRNCDMIAITSLQRLYLLYYPLMDSDCAHQLVLWLTPFKVGNMGTAISETKLMDKWAASKHTQVSAILCIKLLPLLENALKLNFKALYKTENLDPLQGPTHTLTPSSIHTQNRPKTTVGFTT